MHFRKLSGRTVGLVLGCFGGDGAVVGYVGQGLMVRETSEGRI